MFSGDPGCWILVVAKCSFVFHLVSSIQHLVSSIQSYLLKRF